MFFKKLLLKIEGHKEKVYLGKNAEVSRGSRLICLRPDNYIDIGENTHVDPYTVLDTQKKGYIKIGRDSSLHYFSIILAGGGVEIGNDVRIAPHALILTGSHNFDDTTRNIHGQGSSFVKITIEDDVFVGAGVTILAGVTVGAHSVLAAGSVVTKDVPPESVVAGNPARILRKRGEVRALDI